MATEQLPLDTVIGSSGLNDATVAQLDNDPAVGDGNWAVATGNNISTEVHAGFPTPADNLNNGADLQEFKMRVRPFDSGQTGDPNARLELWEAGVLVRAGSNTTLQNGGGEIVISFTWDATEISVAADVEAKFIGTKTGGSPGTRNTVDINAIEWNADTSSGAQIVTPDAVLDAIVTADPTIIIGTVTLSPDALLDTIVVVAPVLVIGTVTLSPDAVLDAIVTVDPVISNLNTLTPSALADSIVVADPVILIGAVTLAPDALSALWTTATPTVTNVSGFRVSTISSFRVSPVVSSFRQQPVIG